MATSVNNRFIWGTIVAFLHGARMRTIHVFAETGTARRGWSANVPGLDPGIADHDDERPVPDAKRFGYFAASPNGAGGAR